MGKVKLTVLHHLKWTQVVLAMATSIWLCSVLFPSVEVVLVAPLCSLYVFWTVRAMDDHQTSMRLACLTSLAVAVALGALTVAGGLRLDQVFSEDLATQSSVVVSANGEASVLDLPPAGIQAALKLKKKFENRRQRVTAILRLILTATAWSVVVMHAHQWRWLVSKRPYQSG